MQVRKKQEPPVKPERNSHVKSLTFSFLKGFLKKSKLFQNLLLQIENILEFLKTLLYFVQFSNAKRYKMPGHITDHQHQ